MISDMVAMGEKPGQEPWEGLQGKPSRQKEGHRPVPRGNSVGKSVNARRLLPGPGSRSAPLCLASEKCPRPHL